MRGLSSCGERQGVGRMKRGLCLLLLLPAPYPPPRCSRAKSGCSRAPSTRDQGAGRFSLLPGGFIQRSSLVPPSPGCRRCLTSTFWLQPLAKSAQLPPQPARQRGRQHPRHPPPSPHPAALSCPCHGLAPRAAAVFLLLLLAIPPARGRQLAPARSDLSCVKRGQFSAPLHQTPPGMGEEVAGAAPSDVAG